MSRLSLACSLLCSILATSPAVSRAQEPQKKPQQDYPQLIETKLATLIGLNKRSGQAKRLSAKVGQSVDFETLSIQLLACKYIRNQGYEDSAALLQISEKDEGTLFQGWMFAQSPALNFIEHAIYDVWLKECIVTEAE